MRSPSSWPLALFVVAAVLALHAARLVRPALWFDDFEILERSWTWPDTRAGLWAPQNEHAMPLGRLTTWGLIQLAGRLTALPFATGWQGPLALLLGLFLLFHFIRRERGDALHGWLAVILFGVTSAYQEAVTWFAASFGVLSLDTFLLALLAAQRWRLGGHGAYLILAALGAALAPCWFGLGVVAGPLCTLYLLPRDGAASGWRRRVLAFVPLLGTAAFLAVSWLYTSHRILYLMRADDRLSLFRTDGQGGSVFVPWQVLANTGRALVDHVALGAVGVGGVTCPPALVPLPLLGLLAAAAWWWRRAPARGLCLLGAGAVLLNYALIYVGRSHLAYEDMVLWSRYHLLAHFGLVLFLCGGLPEKLERGPGPFLLVGVLCLMHLPRGVLGSWWDVPGQQAALHEIETVDAHCRELRIAADTARTALGHRVVPYAGEHVNGWRFLWGSADPLPHSVEDARRLLALPTCDN